MRSLEQYSRRAFMGAAALSPFAARAQETPASATIAAATDKARHLTVGVQINGRGPFRFVVDTGADHSILAEEVANALDLTRGARVMVEGVIRSVPADTVQIAKLVAGPVVRQNLKLALLPRAQLMADGYLGLDFIDGYRVTFDFRNGLLGFDEPLHLPRHLVLLGWQRPNEITVPLIGQHGHLHAVDCGIDGLRAVAFVDTGAEISVGNSRLFEALAAGDPTYVKPVTVPMTGVTGGTVTGRVTTLRHVRMSALRFENGSIAIADLQIFDLWGLSKQPALLVGMNWLRRFPSMSIDYGSKALQFRLAGRTLGEVV